MNEFDILEHTINSINKEIIFGNENPFVNANLAIAYAFTVEDSNHIKYSIDIVNDIFKTNFLHTDIDKIINFLQKELMNYNNWNYIECVDSKICFTFLAYDIGGNIFDEVMSPIILYVNFDSNNSVIDYEITY